MAVINYKAVRRSLKSLRSQVGSAMVGFIQSATGAVPRDLQSKSRDVLSVFDFMTAAQRADVLARTKTEDVTTAVQAAMAAGVVMGLEVFWPAGTYKITDTLPVTSFTQIRGEHRNMSLRAFGTDPLGTVISFQPETALPLFQASGDTEFGSFRSSVSIDGFFLEGNSTDATGNSTYAIDVDLIVRSRFSNLAIQKFRTGIRCDATINNRFEFIFIGSCYVSAVLYDGGTATTDVWEQCYLNTAPVGVETNGTSVNIRWVNCIFESFEDYGVNLVREVYGWQFFNCYSEDVPSTANANGCMFRVGYDGTTLAGSPQLFVSGGQFGGNNSSATGAFLDVDYTDGVVIGGLHASRWTYAVNSTANTLTNQIVSRGFTSGCTNQVLDLTKIAGAYPSSGHSTSFRNEQRYKAAVMYCPIHRADTTSTGTWALAATTMSLTVTSVIPGADNATSNGTSAARWSHSYATEFHPGAGAVTWTSGSGTPEGAVTAAVGSLYTRTNGGANTTLYVKESGTGNTGWVAK